MSTDTSCINQVRLLQMLRDTWLLGEVAIRQMDIREHLLSFLTQYDARSKCGPLICSDTIGSCVHHETAHIHAHSRSLTVAPAGTACLRSQDGGSSGDQTGPPR